MMDNSEIEDREMTDRLMQDRYERYIDDNTIER